MGVVKLRSLAVAGGVATRTGVEWLTVVQLLCVDGSLGADRAGPAAVFWIKICIAKSYMVHVLLSNAFVMFQVSFLLMGLVSYFGSLCVVSGELVFKVC